jgi:hypothetical protein
MSFISQGFYGGADNVTHYFISRYSYKYPRLFFDTWGRPVFTIMASPFCQFGFHGLKLFNVLLGCLTALLAFLTAGKIGINRAWLVILFVIFTPMYFLMTLTGLTEIQFGFILILSVYLFFDEKYILSAIIISFIPLSRSEGFAFIPIFLVALLLKRKFLAIPFLISGLLFFSILGHFFIWKDFFWIFTHSPYPLHHPIYKEKGPLLHFVSSSPEIFGIPLLILFLSGIVIYFYLFFKAEKKQRLQIFLEIWMLVLPVLLFFAVHSLLYWKAWFGSMGLIRVITGVLPLAAIVSLKTYDYIEKKFIKIIIFRKFFLYLVIILIILSNFLIHRFPVQLSPGEKAMKEAINWFKKSPYIKQKIFYTDPDVPFLLGLDPYDLSDCEQKITTAWLLAFPENTVIIWDSYFGTHECKVPIDILEKTGAYRLLNVFRPVPSKDSWYDPDYQICIFKKAPYGKFINNKPIRDSIEAKKNETSAVQFITGDTFEKELKKKNSHASAEVALSGTWSYKSNSWEEFILPYELDLSEIIQQKKNVSIRVTCYVYPLVPFKENDTRLVITLKDKNEYYHSLPLDSVARQINQWNRVSFKATFPLIKSTDRLVVYFWHLGKKEFYIDNFKIERVVP